MPDYTITLKIRCRKRALLKDIDRIFKTGRFQENLEFSLSEGIIDRLRLAYLDVSEVDVTARFSSRKRAVKGLAANFPGKQTHTKQTHTQATKNPVKKGVKVK